MALSSKAKKRFEAAMAKRTEATEISAALDKATADIVTLSAATAGGTLASTNILVGNGSNVATAVAVSGDATLANTGALTIAALAVTTGKLAATAVTAAKINFFKSTEQTGTGSSQNVAHGLGATPGLVIIQITEALAADSTYVEGAHDGTNVVMTVTSGAKFKVIAVK